MKTTTTQFSAGRPLFWGCLALVLLIGGLGAWSVLTTLSGAIVAPGQVEVSQNRQIVQHPDGGVVEEILVEEGAKVAKGDILLRVDGSGLRSELAIVENQLVEFAARRARLEAQRDVSTEVNFPSDLVAAAASNRDVSEVLAGQKSLFAKQAEALAQAEDLRRTRIEQIMNQVDGLAAQQDAVEVQMELLAKDLETQRDLFERGLAPSVRASEIERDLAELKGRLGELISARAEAAGRITEIEIEISSLKSQQREKAEAELRDIVAKQLELLERDRALSERFGRLEVRAPAAGLVLGLQVTTPRSVIRPAEALMYIVPQDRPLLVAARVPVTHVDEIRTGQDVRLVFSSLPSRTTPEVRGRVTLVSADALADERTGVTYFRTEIAIDADALKGVEGIDIVPGMPVDAFIRTGDRTPLSYLLKPFTDYFRTAFRET